jgi:hypothetical protein
MSHIYASLAYGHFSPSREVRFDQLRRIRVAEGLRHHALAAVNAELAKPATTNPPTYQQVAEQHGWNTAAGLVNQWMADGSKGEWTDQLEDGAE